MRGRETFLKSLSECVGSFHGKENVCLFGGLNARVDNRSGNKITGPFELDGLYENMTEMIESVQRGFFDRKYMVLAGRH